LDVFTSLRDGNALPVLSALDTVEKDDEHALVNMVCKPETAFLFCDSFLFATSVLHKTLKVLHKTAFFVLVTVEILCVLRVSHRFSEHKENPENTVFSGSVSFL
jgi:hypothetical protein